MKFNVKGAYMLANEWAELDIWEGWRMHWRTKILHPVKVFTWLMEHEKLLINRER